jgi:hypothetical protein
MLILEGRKEDIYNKYKSKIDVERKLNSLIEPISVYDILIQDPYIQDTNYKFLEPLILQYYTENEIYPRQGEELEELEPNIPSISRDSIIRKRQFVNTIVPKVQFFENNKDKYPKKDLRQYVGNSFDNDFISFTIDLMEKQSKKKEKVEAKKDSVKLYEDENLLVVKPLTHQASCYYGSGTKWCTTMAGTPSYFNQYTRNGNLYYIILKKITRESKYAKIALLLKPRVRFDDGEFYDTKDHLLTKNEIELFKNFVIQNAVNAINDDNERDQRQKWFNNIVNELTEFGRDVKNLEFNAKLDYLSSTAPFMIRLKVLNIYEAPELGEFDDSERFIRYEMTVRVDCPQYPNLDGLILVGGIINDLTDEEYEVQSDYQTEIDDFEFLDGDYLINTYKKKIGDTLRSIVVKIISDQLINGKILKSEKIKKIYENWFNKSFKRRYTNAGYTFEKGGKLTKSLIDYLDSLPEDGVGNKLDFLQKTGKVKITPEGSFNEFGRKISLQGYLSSFFSAVRQAGIVEKPEGKKGFKKGPNFEKYKEKFN